MTICYLALGSNLQNPQRQLRKALLHLKSLPKTQVLKCSSFYFNQALGRKCQPNFYNAVVAIQTHLPPKTLLRYCQAIERKHQRVKKVFWGTRTLDIDIILYGDYRLHYPHLLTVPHPRMHERDFVIVPLTEIGGLPC